MRWFDAVSADGRQAVRQLHRAPVLTASAVMTFSFVIGAATAGTTLVRAVLWKRLPFSSPERLIWIAAQAPGLPGGTQRFGYPTVRELERRLEGIAETAAISPTGTFNLLWQRPTGPEPVAGSFVSPNMFRVLGAKAAIGRVFGPGDPAPGAVISNRFWRTRLGGDPTVIGASMAFPGAFTILGVLPPGFRLDEEVDVWLAYEPQTFADWGPERRAFHVVARMAPGVQATAVADRLAGARAVLGPLVVNDLQRALVGDARPALWLLFAAICCVVTLGCVNVATLLLDRSVGREREIAIRSALGATPGRITAQLIVESTVLAGIGGAVGMGLTYWLIRSMAGEAVAMLPQLEGLQPDAGLIVATFAATSICGLVAGLLPARQLGGTLGNALHGFQTTERRHVRHIRRTLAIAQVALAFGLLVAAGLVLRSLVNVLSVDLGYRPDGVLAVQLSSDIGDARSRVVFFENLFERVRTLPGVLDVGAATRVPLREGGAARVEREGRTDGDGASLEIELRRASRSYFRTLGIRTASGRTFGTSDRLGSPSVAVVNETAERLLWPGQSAVGRRLRLVRPQQESPWLTVIGVVGDVRHFGPESEPRPEVYLSLEQGPPFGPLLVVRASGDPLSLAGRVRQAVWQLAADTEALGASSLGELLAERTAPRRYGVWILSMFGAFAVVLAFVGVYATVSRVTGGRRRELALRMALGASPGSVLRMALFDAFLYALPGLALGAVAGIAASRLLGHWMFGIGALDSPALLAIVAAGVAAVVVLASLAPAVRAARLDPASVLKAE